MVYHKSFLKNKYKKNLESGLISRDSRPSVEENKLMYDNENSVSIPEKQNNAQE